MIARLRSKRFRDVMLQAGFAGLLLTFLVVLVSTALNNLEAQGITSGFDFLWRATGWDVNFSLIPFSASDSYIRVIAIGLMNTAFLGAISLVLASIIGVMVGVLRASGNDMGKWIGASYVELFRNVPLLLQMFFWYSILLSLPKPRESEMIWGLISITGRGTYLPSVNIDATHGLAAFVVLFLTLAVSLWVWKSNRGQSLPHRGPLLWGGLGIGLLAFSLLLYAGQMDGRDFWNLPELKGLNYRGGIRIGSELLCCIIAISIYGSAYIAEIVRAGLNAVGRGQVEAGHALGLSKWHVFTRIRLPLAVRIMMPILANQYVWLMKATTVGAAVGFSDYFFVILNSINQSGQTIELIGLLMGGFLLMNYLLGWVMNRINSSLSLKGN